MSFKSCDDQDATDDPDEDSGYEFEITLYSKDNLDRITESIRNKGRGQVWDFFDPEDLANKALRKLWKYAILHPACCRDKEWIDKEVSTIVVRIWIDEVRRERKKRNLRRSGAFCVSLFGDLDEPAADFGQEFAVALRELLEHVKADLTARQNRIVDLRMENQVVSEIALKLKVSESTIDKELVSIKKKIVLSMAKISDNEQRATNNEQRTTNNGQRTTDNGQRTTDNGQRTTDNGQRTTEATRPEQIVLNSLKIVYASRTVLSLKTV